LSHVSYASKAAESSLSRSLSYLPKYTGADSSRPQYQEMLGAAERGEFDILLVDDLSRLARDQVESERAIRRL
jgi:DNA invertase Pin-like site-specific DNA recombinase